MAKVANPDSSKELMQLLSRLLLSPCETDAASSTAQSLRTISREKFGHLTTLASSNHVIVRSMEIIRRMMLDAHDSVRAEWAETALIEERARIANAIEHLHAICSAFDEAGLDATVIKSLDHWPDLGSDIDLYSNTPTTAICDLMTKTFGAQIASRSWGDRLANKWNFNIPGMPEPVEVHAGRLGQTGEQKVLAARLPGRARLMQIDGQSFRVPSASDRLMISTLQRMYRHFYFRLCDIVDSATLATSGAVDYADLRSSAKAAGVWEGVATYMVIVSDYVRQYRGADLGLPESVRSAARFGGKIVYFSRDFLRVPILPQSAGLYRTQLSGLLRNWELHSSARLGLLPMLATAAAVGYKLTGSDKGIW